MQPVIDILIISSCLFFGHHPQTVHSLYLLYFYIYTESTREANGKILIHCRVGVSRSATITIAYVMRHLNRSLVSSYLFVRARRLNVIIQPNLKFMYELLQYEQKLTGRMSISWGWLAKEIHALNMCYVGI
jgi:dual specificity MAP kinase phosphatase